MCRDVGVTACEGKQRLLFLSENVSDLEYPGNYLFSSSVFILHRGGKDDYNRSPCYRMGACPRGTRLYSFLLGILVGGRPQRVAPTVRGEHYQWQ